MVAVYMKTVPGSRLPKLAWCGPFLSMVVAERGHRQSPVRCWRVRSGRLSTKVRGVDCPGWDASVDWASIEQCCADLPIFHTDARSREKDLLGVYLPVWLP